MMDYVNAFVSMLNGMSPYPMRLDQIKVPACYTFVMRGNLINNEEGKNIANEISPHNKSITCRDFNLVKPHGKSTKTISDLSFYNSNAKSFVITAVRVQYQDGSAASMNAAKCQAMMEKNRKITPEEKRFFKERWLE